MANPQKRTDIYTNVHDLHEVHRALRQIVARLPIAGLLMDSQQNELLDLEEAADAVNYVKITNAAAGSDPSITAVGDDATVDLVIGGQGGGGVQLSTDVEVVGELIASGGIKVSDPDTIHSETDTDILITPNGSGDLILDGQKWPQGVGTAGYVLTTDGATPAQTTWSSGKESHIPMMDSGALVAF
jgi:hypothetical protein